MPAAGCTTRSLGADFPAADFVPLASFGFDRYSVSSEVDAGLRKENASNQNDRASVLIPSEPKRL
jgi:hypothetical protein